MAKELGIDEGMRLKLVQSRWDSLITPPASLHIYPASFKQGELVINVDSPVWLQQMGFFKKEMLSKLSALGVKDIKLRLGRVLRKTRTAETKTEYKSLDETDMEFIEQTIKPLHDAELAVTIRRTIAKSLSSKPRKPKDT